MILLVGEYQCSLDAKNRLMIPANFRRELDKNGSAGRWYAVLHVHEQLWLMPEEEFAAQVAKIRPTLLPTDEQMDFVQKLFSRSWLIEPDKAGRVLLPEKLLAKAGLGKELTVVGNGRHVVIHDSARWAKQQLQDDFEESFKRARAAGIEVQGS